MIEFHNFPSVNGMVRVNGRSRPCGGNCVQGLGVVLAVGIAGIYDCLSRCVCVVVGALLLALETIRPWSVPLGWVRAAKIDRRDDLHASVALIKSLTTPSICSIMSLEAETITDWVRRSATTITVSSRFILGLSALPAGCCPAKRPEAETHGAVVLIGGRVEGNIASAHRRFPRISMFK